MANNNKIILLFLLFSITSLSYLLGQPLLELKWDSIYQTGNAETINDALILPNGNIALVGSIKRSRKKGKDGLLLIIDSETGAILTTFSDLAYAGDDEFKSIAMSAVDGSFYIVGSTERNKSSGKQKDAWLVQLSIWGDEINILRDTSFGGNTDDSFEKVVWMRDAALIAGYQNKGNGHIWVLSIDNKKIKFNAASFGEGYFKDIVGLEKGANNRYWLCGNTRKSKEEQVKEGDIWYSLIDEKGRDIILDVYSKKEWCQAFGTNSTIEGNLLITGESWWRNVDADDWLIELDDNGKEVGTLRGNGTEQERGKAALKTPQGKYWIAKTTSPEEKFPLRVTDQKLDLYHDFTEELPYITEHLKELRDNFEVQKLLRTPFDNYLLIGTTFGRKEKETAIRVLSFKNGSYLAEKGVTDLKKIATRLVDNNQDNIISPKELGAIQFSLENTGDSPIPNGKIKISSKDLVTGLQFRYPEMVLGYLAPGSRKDYALPLKGAANLATGKSTIQFSIIVKGKEVLTFSQEVACGKPSKKAADTQIQQSVVMGWREPDLTVSNGKRTFPTKQKSFPIKVAVTSQNELKKEDFKVRKNGVVVQDERNKPNLTSPVKENAYFQYTFSYVITDLVVGENKIFVELPDGTLNPIIINYQPEQPNLHVLAIGPSYDDLKYTVKDARDFALMAKQQEGNGFFNKVFVDTLLSPLNTTKTDIEIAFENLAKRVKEKSLANYIQPNDYVMIFFSGHGLNREGKFRLLPTNYRNDYLSTMIDYQSDILEKNLRNMGCTIIIFIDACLSGNAQGAKAPEDLALSDALLKANRSLPSLTAYTSCSKNQSSYEDASWENGAFTEALLEAMSGKEILLESGERLIVDVSNAELAGGGKNIISINELSDFLQKRVPDLVKQKGVSQIPTFKTGNTEIHFPIFQLENP